MDDFFILETVFFVTLAIIGAAVFVMALIQRDTDFITSNPMSFLAEVLALGILPAIAFGTLCLTRGVPLDRAMSRVLTFMAVLLGGHILLQLAGYYNAWAMK